MSDPINILAIASTDKSNAGFGNVVQSELSGIPNVSYVQYDTFKRGFRELSNAPSMYSAIVLDGAAVGGDFRTAVSVLPRVPVVICPERRTAPVTPAAALDMGIDPGLVVARPFSRGTLRDKISLLAERLIAPPNPKLRGLFINRATHNVYLDGKPIQEQFLGIERELISFLINETHQPQAPRKNTSLLERFRQEVLGEHIDEQAAQRVLTTFSQRLGRTLASVTNGEYKVEPTIDNGTVVACKLVSTKGAPPARYTT